VAEATRRFEVMTLLGKGGMGAVYKAKLVDLRGFSRIVALKVLHDDLARIDDMTRRLRDEARLLAVLRHRVIVQVEELVRLHGHWVIVMEYVEGPDLERAIRKFGRLPPTIALEILGDVASALDNAWHHPGPDGVPLHLIHRDVKPANIHVTPLGETKLLDFGIARADLRTREALTEDRTFGSLAYMSPERLDLEDGPEGDVYALGATAYELLTGQLLGKTSANEERHRDHIAACVARLVELQIAQPIIDLVTSALHYDKARRPTARAFERQCHQLLRGLPGTHLRDWTEQHLTSAQWDAPDREPGRGQSDLSGTVLVEDHGSPRRVRGRSLAPEAAHQAEKRTETAMWAVGIGLLVLTIALLGFTSWLVLSER
jgi:serine/threonine-protein kinase